MPEAKTNSEHLIAGLQNRIDDLLDVVKELEWSICDEPPLQMTKTTIIPCHCPYCGHSEQDGHLDLCIINKALTQDY